MHGGHPESFHEKRGSGEDLRAALRAIDGRGYPAYKSLAGTYICPGYQLVIEHVQGDPFASPSAVGVLLSPAESGLPAWTHETKARRIASEDVLTRAFAAAAEEVSFHAGGSGKSGLIGSSRPGQEVLERTCCHIGDDGSVTFHLRMGFPADGRRVRARSLEKMLFEFLPSIVQRSLTLDGAGERTLRSACDLADDREAVLAALKEKWAVAFIADGSILPRESGVSQRSLPHAVRFKSPDSLAATLRLPHRGEVRGMLIRKGITLIVGGGYHGKSTILNAISLGVYPHIAGDGRELVVTDPTAVRIRSEDGRSISCTDVSPFIGHLPDGSDSAHFSSPNASGSTSQAANVAEALEAGAKTLLIDEDTSATNFMMRDALMNAVVPSESEPITPFISRIGDLKKEGISVILVAGSFGAYFEVSDTVIRMDAYRASDVTETAKEAVKACAYKVPEAADPWHMPSFDRRPLPCRELLGDRVKMKNLGLEGFLADREKVDLRYVGQLVDAEQSETLAACLLWLGRNAFDGKRTLRECVSLLMEKIAREGLSSLSHGTVPLVAMPREQEIFAAVNRFRRLRIIHPPASSGS